MNMSKPLVSVVLSTYNDECFIGETIASVLAQTYNYLEFIIWNDGSTDGTESVVNTFSDPRIRYFSHENMGVGLARKMATAKASGMYIAVIDGDDIWTPYRLEEGVEFMESHPEYVLLSSQMKYIDEDGKLLGQSFACSSEFIIRKRIPYTCMVSHPASMFRKSVYDEVGGYVGVRMSLDHLLFARMMKKGRVKILNSPLIYYRLRRGSLYHSMQESPYMPILRDFRYKMSEDNDVSEEDVELYNQIYVRSKEYLKTIPNSTPILYRKTTEDQLFSFLKHLIGEKNARDVIISMKNLLFYIKYKLSIY